MGRPSHTRATLANNVADVGKRFGKSGEVVGQVGGIEPVIARRQFSPHHRGENYWTWR
ncbi:MAG: hypothetical protein R3E31_02175 [Chloroflexota bacterium]